MADTSLRMVNSIRLNGTVRDSWAGSSEVSGELNANMLESVPNRN
jgi:hypothetical protein